MKIPALNKPRRLFIAHILVLFLSVPGRRCLLNLSRWSEYCEKTFRLHFSQVFDWQGFNSELVRQTGHDLIIAIDPTFLPKSGERTYGKGKFWSGVSGKVMPGLDFLGISVIDLNRETALHYRAIQTPNKESLEDSGTGLLKHYANVVAKEGPNLRKLSRYLVADAYFSKAPFVEQVLLADLDFIGKMRKDISLRYLYSGPPTGKKGAPKKYDGKVDAKDLRKNYFSRTETQEAVLYSGRLNVTSWKTEMKVVFVYSADEKSLGAILFTTDEDLPAETVLKYYRLRFQIEFLYRDAKQFAGMTHCQSRSKEALDFHVNASLTAVSAAKVQHYYGQKSEVKRVYSLADIRNRLMNRLMIERFISVFGIQADTEENKEKIRRLLLQGQIAA